MRSTPLPRAPALLLACLVGVLTGSASACLDPLEQCQGNIEVSCDATGCTCATGAHEGEACEDIPNSTDPETCEQLCCGAGPGVPGPPSILRGSHT